MDKMSFMVTYESFTGAGSFDAFLLKIDSNGNLQWSKMFGGSTLDYGSCDRLPV